MIDAYCAISLCCILGPQASKSPRGFLRKITSLPWTYYKNFFVCVMVCICFLFYFFINRSFNLFLVSFSGGLMGAKETLIGIKTHTREWT